MNSSWFYEPQANHENKPEMEVCWNTAKWIEAELLAEMPKENCGIRFRSCNRPLEGRITAPHRFLLRELLDHLYFVESKMRRIEQEVEERLGPFQREVARLCTIPSVDLPSI